MQLHNYCRFNQTIDGLFQGLDDNEMERIFPSGLNKVVFVESGLNIPELSILNV